MFVWLLIGILLSFGIWYVLWIREQFFNGLTKILDIIVEEYRLEYPDEDIRNLRICYNGEVLGGQKKKEKK